MFRFVLYFFLFLFNYFHYIGTVAVFCGTRSAATTYSFCWFTVGLLFVVAFYFIFRYRCDCCWLLLYLVLCDL